MSYLQRAFDSVCKDAKPAEGFYVCLMEHSSRYGGPEEGGWWATDTDIVAYQYFPTVEGAEAARAVIESLAEELEAEAERAYGDKCLRDMEWLEVRGLEADWLGEDDGPSQFFVIVSEGLPAPSRGPTHYE